MLKRLFIILVPVLLVGGCYPAGPEYYEDLDVVATRFDRDFNFAGTNKTYTMPSKIVKITGNAAGEGDPEFVSDAVASQIFARIRANMTSYGWTYTDNAETAGVTILPAVWQNTTVFYWYDYWCWYYPYYCGWGWGYPSVSSYTTGTLLMAMTSYNAALEEPQRVWMGGINGLLSGAYDVSRVNTGIDQAFTQSPYLKVN
jgi:hypothetical protein